MGCFSFKCKVSGKAVASSSFSGDAVRMFLLKNGKVIEEMHGHYDSYGRVFKNTKDEDDISMTEFSSYKWKMDWLEVCDLMFSSNVANGIAVVLDKYWNGVVPTTRSENDPNQGWGRPQGGKIKVAEPYHKVY